MPASLLENIGKLQTQKRNYCSLSWVQSVGMVRKHPGRVVNRTKSALSAWRALKKVAAKWKSLFTSISS